MARLIVEADGGSRGNPGVAGYGALVRDAATSAVLAERAAPLGQASNNVAEYSGLIAGLEAAAEIDPAADVEVRMDSKLVVEQMSGRWKIKHEDMRRLAVQARELVRERGAAGGAVTFTWIPRERNKAADKLSNDGMDGRTIARLVGRDEGANDDIDDDIDDARPDPARHDAPATEGVTGRARVTAARKAARGERQAQTASPGPDLAAPVRVVLVRHGATEATRSGVLDGRGGTDGPLSSDGHREASAAAHELRRRLQGSPARVITSSLRRARETGEAIAAAVGVPAETDERWDEQHFGDWEGHTVAQACAEDPAGYAQLRVSSDYARPGGESRADLRARVEAAYDDLLRDSPGGWVIVVSHRAAMLAVLEAELGLSSPWSLTLSPGGLTSLRRWSDGGCAVDAINDTAHLRA